MSGDALQLKMYNDQIEQARFDGYCQGKKVIQQWAINTRKHLEEDMRNEKKM